MKIFSSYLINFLLIIILISCSKPSDKNRNKAMLLENEFSGKYIIKFDPFGLYVKLLSQRGDEDLEVNAERIFIEIMEIDLDKGRINNKEYVYLNVYICDEVFNECNFNYQLAYDPKSKKIEKGFVEIY